ncbi:MULTISPECIES: M23 family metallopeptidase [Castellaniella]|jgi:murein DD-endopeptidase MepM/ murein hydrolase activator NlpD|uniref:M23 family metallopeptidase n=2 Tax=Castellaniella TaxID=359336 RepID=A0AB39DGW0_9BURK|nr:M23 family metallopeptidase [Castellaniella denitrificans]MCZ4331207.1 M23 family metallopeptidase [Castellaniella denitrificans]
MHPKLKSFLLIFGYLVTNAVMASEVRQTSIAEGPVYMLGKHSHNQTPRLEGLQKMFLDTPLIEHLRINSGFGYRLHPLSGEWAGHQGLDFPAPKGTPIRATARGKISFIGTQSGYGKVIFVEHNYGYSTVYAHQSRFKNGLRKGVGIEKGQIIGYVGSTGISSGPHLHYELRVNNRPVDPIQEKQQLVSHVQR